MGENSKIEWTTHTFNPWWGCVKVSEACKHCYAEAWAKRVGQKVWGPTTHRRFFGDAHWKQPETWNRRLEGTGQRERVFCASMADVFEDRRDLDPHRARLWSLIETTPNLDWLLLTKRPDVATRLNRWGTNWPANVWLGTTVENQQRADENLPHLVGIPARVRFISAEPLLGPLNLSAYLERLDWVITGGESGPKARPASPTWFRQLHLQCMEHEVSFHFKQWGDWAPGDGINLPHRRTQQAHDGTLMVRLGKKAAGRELDGATHDGLPESSRAI
ncbi:hypothetical protein BV509_00950 [Rhodovulum sulfidophilum]|uniref:Phage Gp37/Gp68 family protein n=1 Tax=Rhodovulum visakhapatnamense TaxID=364297 RepID=A0ABS1RFV3_9RHOB|nr:phage Gp37/Gp68 family protein [Rhodovulum visakhapatnamense]MBL3569903.1 phage Gp37/Gp68 family protein [Rhodovulum visakhapatnamense]MBL3578404.1 phage Gp37/Gp68 family protein [Rhodovulum visakhapatnamense]OLS43056.1 hypothetical protein BV509_00950 [Rhodovulum sulfidophilum]